MPRAAVLLRVAAVIALIIGYTSLAHHTNTTPGYATLGSLIALAPFVLAALTLALRSTRRALMLALVALACVALWLAWPAIQQHYSRLYWIEHAGAQLILGAVFARTLAAGREPMCSYFARMVHGPLTSIMLRYTRGVTIAWVAFFGAMAAGSTLLYFLAPLGVWSAFANFFTLPLTALMFIAEYAARRHAHLDMAQVSILAAVQAVWKSPPGQSTAQQHVHHANPATDYPSSR